MGVAAVLTPTVDPTARGALLTFLAPAPDGCGMSCSYCFIEQRREKLDEVILQPADFARFIEEAAASRPVAAVTVQGYEPLADEAMPWTEAILAAGQRIGAETGLVTNGLGLEKYASTLGRLGCTGVTVSIDADTEARHDRLRWRPGAWAAAFNGLAAALREIPQGRVLVHSVLFPGHAARLAGLPAVLARRGVRLWTVSPFIRFQQDGQAAAHGSQAQLADDLAVLSKAARSAGITFMTDDEFGVLDRPATTGAISDDTPVRTFTVPGNLLRMTPDGACAFGQDVLTMATPDDMRWTPGEDVKAYLDSQFQ
jgi:molybdenum cofactor biosynthesis enzyme MoaA